MDWSLQKIELENFKFFKDSFVFPVDGKHILLYGENGSGKSSIVWGLYTLMESRMKPVAEVQKYFNPANDQHLRNRYSHPEDYSSVKTTFMPLIEGAVPKEYEISSAIITTQTATDDFMKYTTAAFDMFNYKMLSEWIYQKNSRSIDLFEGFEKDVFNYLYFSRSYDCIDGTSSAPNGNTAAEWWKYIKRVSLPLTKRSQVNRSTPEYIRFTALLRDFKDEMDSVLMQVERSANDMIHNDLGLPNITIEINMSQVPFNLLKPNCKRYKDGKVHDPQIRVKAHVVDNNIPDWSTEVQHLATFFNESKLTCIGIALRFAISDYKLISTGNVSPVLCIDDLLLSLDMSARIPIIKLFIKKAQNRQLLVFTHDRSFFEIMQMMIRESHQESKWNFYEMLERNSSSFGSVPKPLFFPSKTNRDKAEYHFEQGDYPAAANYLRKYCEEQLKCLLPNNLQLTPKNNGEIGRANLNGLINKLESDFCTLYGITSIDLPSLSVYRNKLMNPMSHDNAHTPVYKAEIISAMKEIDKLKTIADSLKTICNGDGTIEDEFEMSVVNGANSEFIEFIVLEKWTSIEVLGRRYYKDVKIKVISSTAATILSQDYDSLRNVFRTICKKLGLNAPTAIMPEMETTITNKNSHVALTAI